MSYKVKQVGNELRYVFTQSKRSRLKTSIRSQKRLSISTKKHLTLPQIERYEKRLYETLLDDLRAKESKGISFIDLTDKWYDYEFKQAQLDRKTITDYYSAIKKWCYTIHDTEAEKITRRDINIVFSHLTKQGISKSHQQTIKTIINHVFNWGNAEGYIAVDLLPTRGISVKRSQEKVPEILTENQARDFLKNAKELDHEWYPIWLAALLTGCRNGELFALRWSDVSMENQLITVSRSYNSRTKIFKSTKSGEYRNVPINKDLMNLLKELRVTTYSTGYVLPRIQAWKAGQQARELRTFLKCIGMPSIRFHSLRACFCTILLSQGQKPAQIMKVCGWKNLKTMERYVRMAGVDEKGLTDALELTPQEGIGELLTVNFREDG